MRIGKAAAVIAPVVLAGALFFVAIRLGDPARTLGEIHRLPLSVLGVALLMAAIYLGLKVWQLHLLLGNLGIHPDWGRLGLAFAVGELALTLPFGLFAQNWVLARKGRAHFRVVWTGAMWLCNLPIVVLLWRV